MQILIYVMVIFNECIVCASFGQEYAPLPCTSNNGREGYRFFHSRENYQLIYVPLSTFQMTWYRLSLSLVLWLVTLHYLIQEKNQVKIDLNALSAS
jgi:hypothetical protein